MKNIIFAVFLFPLFINAQTKLYIEPTVQLMKLSITSTSYTSQTKLMAQPFDAQIATRSIRLSEPTMGLNLGVSFKGGKRNLSIGVNKDRASFGYDIASNGNSKKPASHVGSSQSSISYTRWNLTFEQRLSNGSRQHQWYALAGIGLVFNNDRSQRGSLGELLPGDTVGSVTSDFVFMDLFVAAFSPSLTIGLKTDFYSKKGKYLLSSSLFYVHGFEEIAQMYITHTSAVGLDRRITMNSIYSKGSGIYLQFSRRLNLRLDKKPKENISQYY